MIVMEDNRRRCARNPKARAAIDATMVVLRAQFSSLGGDMEGTARGALKKVVLVACIRRLLGILNAIVRTSMPWQTA
ncbi:hypothetical protein EAH89_25435 [Roseomonas nepalensis]|uniref:Transposase IS116/IS110/IS902 family protein n=2 Tax=Muricoccus nepalensis TaxID=1854500 RepID=A0A502F9J6_9PROT|nr:hypothetical protein EAH89_25435 [Roseomonas nepalensis]